ncbi:hypothetical protein CENSYa_0273 [Cenarchaeum symbiosum A]|uniref:Uncharacterized protein n=1 Tax=Cenarchaeum symbiosum (strain A) TaxID=414004 RepID=A0RU96_CENSY|nr:hypothetical protein CENSYa_0273 [Cenarchaeum symbiosum A]
MSDMRFILIGVGIVFVGYLLFALFSDQFIGPVVKAEQFEDCLAYFEDRPPEPVPCEAALQGKVAFFVVISAVLGAGGVALIKGMRGDWDRRVKPEDMVGPGGSDPDDSKE